MANIKKIELVNLERWDSVENAWKQLRSKKGSDAVEDVTEVVLYDNVTGFDPTSSGFDIRINWASFNNGTDDGNSIFGSDGGLIATTAKSQKIRYKIKTTSAGSPSDVEVTSPAYYYQMLKLALPTTGVISGLPPAAGGSIGAVISINFPGISSSMVWGTGETQTDVQRILQNTANWTANWGLQGGQKNPRSFSAINFSDVSDSAVAEFDGTIQKLTGNILLPVTQSGIYELTITFLPNDQGSALTCAQVLSCTTTVTVNTGGADKLIYSVDGEVQFNMQFTQ